MCIGGDVYFGGIPWEAVEEGRAAVGAVLPALSASICESLEGLKREL